MRLFFRKFGESGITIVIAHGLYGCSDNWLPIAKSLEASHCVYVVDMRNHGQSAHSNVHTYEAMCNDLADFIDEHKIEKPIVVGHSMGGRAAALLAYKFPNLISKLVIVDTSPFNCENQNKLAEEHRNIMLALANLNINACKSHGDADKLLSKQIADVRLRKFLLKNLYRTANGDFSWRFNIEILLKNVNNIICGSLENLANMKIKTPTLLVVGAMSEYVSNADTATVLEHFTHIEINKINDAGHWLHAEKKEEFLNCLQKFIAK